MGIFSLFGKKDSQQGPATISPEARKKARDTAISGTYPAKPDTKPGPDTAPQVTKRKVAAQATVLKIDEIESAMSSEFIKYAPSSNTLPGPVTKAGEPSRSVARKPASSPITPTQPAATPPAPSAPTMGSTTQFLLSEETSVNRAALSQSETAPAIEEAAILYANGQIDIAEHILLAAIQEDALGEAVKIAWHMLFDLYIVSGKLAQFDNLSIDYASKFETSPPTWIDIGATSQQAAPVAGTRSTPAVAFSGKLDSSIVKQLERVKNLAANNAVLRLEFTRVTDVDPVGCGLLLNVLSKLQNSGNDLILVGSLELANKIRTILQVGRRDETEAPWLLLMEILRLLNLEKEFEESSIDYCITFEVSPPAFVAPKNKVTTAIADDATNDDPEHFLMPAVIEGKTDQLIMAIAKYADNHKPAIIDCARLKRVDFGAAGHLLTGLAPLTVKGLIIELHNVNHLVLALFNVIGLKDLVRVLPRKA